VTVNNKEENSSEFCLEFGLWIDGYHIFKEICVVGLTLSYLLKGIQGTINSPPLNAYRHCCLGPCLTPHLITGDIKAIILE
jgi:hypothetical protein